MLSQMSGVLRLRQAPCQCACRPCKADKQLPCSLLAACSPFELSVWRWEESSDAVKAYGVFFGVLALGLIPALQVGSSQREKELIAQSCLGHISPRYTW